MNSFIAFAFFALIAVASAVYVPYGIMGSELVANNAAGTSSAASAAASAASSGNAVNSQRVLHNTALPWVGNPWLSAYPYNVGPLGLNGLAGIGGIGPINALNGGLYI